MKAMRRSTYIYSKYFFLSLLFLFFTATSFAQNSKEFSGKVIDTETKKGLALADLVVVGTNISTITNTDGEFLLKVPENYLSKSVSISFLGYKKLEVPLVDFKIKNTKIKLEPAKKVLALKGENYLNNKMVMTGFYRETIKNRNKNASLSEAVLKIHKQPYISTKRDVITLIKARKNTDYTKLDTLALKLQGGPFSTLYTDVMKYPEFIFTEDNLDYYSFSFGRSTQINNEPVFVINFKQKPSVSEPLYYGKLFIDANTYALTSATYSLDVSNREASSRLFVRKKPRKATVYPTEAFYRVNYRMKDGKWYYGYSNILLTFKVNWKNRLFNSRYTLQSEMAITDWNITTTAFAKTNNRLKPTSIIENEASGFSDPDFWGEYNIIEPEKSIESAIKKINKQLKKV